MTDVIDTIDGGPHTVQRDGGSTLVEIVVSIVLMGTVVLAASSATLALVRTSKTSYDSGQTETTLLNAADRVRRADRSCDYDDELGAEAGAQAWASGSVTATVRTLVANTGSTSDWQPQSDLCAQVDPFDVQEVTITATHPSGNLTRSIVVYKSNEN